MITTVCKISYGSQTVPPIVPAVQGDTGRAISFEIADFTPPAGATATYFILKPSGEAIYNSATITDNSILCELTAQSLAEAGENRMQVRVLQGEDIVTSFEIILMVRTFLGDDAIQSGTEMNIFDQAVEQATEQFQENAEQIVEEVIESIPEDYTELTEEVSELNERLNALEVDYSDTSLWESGGITAAAGEDSVNENRIRTGYISRAINRVTPANGYKVAIYVYSSSDVYIGIYNGNGYQTNALYWYTSTVNLCEIPSEYKLRVVGSKDPESSISASDATNISLEGYTDISLSQSGKAADAKAVEDAISAIEPGLSDEAKTALLNCFEHVAWIDEHGQDYYDALEAALYDTPVEKWDYEWDASSGSIPIGANGVSYPGSILNNFFIFTNPSNAYFFPIADVGAIKLEIEFNILEINETDWWPNFNFALSENLSFYVARTGDGKLRTNISGHYVKLDVDFPQKGTTHKLEVTVSSSGFSYVFDGSISGDGPGANNSENTTSIYLAQSNINKLGLKSVKYKYLN